MISADMYFSQGCQAGAIAPDVVTDVYEDLCRRIEGGVALILGCCGAISEWAGRYEMTEKVNQQLKQELAKLGDPTIIAGCPSCMKQLKEKVWRHSHRNLGNPKGNRTSRTGQRTGNTGCNT